MKAIIKDKQSSSGFEQQKTKIHNYYREAGPDYEIWSKDFNMHFGYWKWGMNPFKREKMLNKMTTEVFNRLKIETPEAKVADLGCGVGASMRFLAKSNPTLKIHGVTFVPWQIHKGLSMTNCDRIKYHREDFTQTSFKNNSLDGTYAIESACHGKGIDKKDFIDEAYRILKPKAKLVVADGFLKNPHLPLSDFASKSYQTLCEAWALPEMAQIDAFVNRLKKTGFRHIKVEDISWNVAPSTGHSPFLIIKYLIKKIWHGEKIGKHSVNNLKGVFLTNLLGLNRKKFSYYLITAEK